MINVGDVVRLLKKEIKHSDGTLFYDDGIEDF